MIRIKQFVEKEELVVQSFDYGKIIQIHFKSPFEPSYLGGINLPLFEDLKDIFKSFYDYNETQISQAIKDDISNTKSFVFIIQLYFQNYFQKFGSEFQGILFLRSLLCSPKTCITTQQKNKLKINSTCEYKCTRLG